MLEKFWFAYIAENSVALSISTAVLMLFVISLLVFLLNYKKRCLLLYNEVVQWNQKHQLLKTQYEMVYQQLEKVNNELKDTRQESREFQNRFISAETRLEELQRQHKNQQELMKLAKQELGQEFTKIAGEILSDSSGNVQQLHRQTLELTLTPFKEQLGIFRKTVEQTYDKDLRDRAGLMAEVEQLKQLNLRMSEEATNLTKALKGDQKTQGIWGEMVLESVLEKSGLRKGYEYEVQRSYLGQDDEKLIPDVIVKLPENKSIIVDSKVSLSAYERYCSSSDKEKIKTLLKQHVQSVKQHIVSLSKKRYESIPEIQTVDFVLIFIPIESAYALALQHDDALVQLAYKHNVILVSPATLLSTLKTVQSIWRYERQNQNANNIALQAGSLHDQLVLAIDAILEIGKALAKGQAAYEKALDRFSRGRGNLVKRARDLEALGAKTKKQFDGNLIEQSEDVSTA